MESQSGLGKLLPKSLSARRKQRSKKSSKTRDGDAASDATTDRGLSTGGGDLSLYADGHEDDHEYTDDADDGSLVSYESSADANRSGES